MGRETKIIKRCPECGTILDSKSRIENEIRRANKALNKYYNKLRKKKK